MSIKKVRFLGDLRNCKHLILTRYSARLSVFVGNDEQGRDKTEEYELNEADFARLQSYWDWIGNAGDAERPRQTRLDEPCIGERQPWIEKILTEWKCDLGKQWECFNVPVPEEMLAELKAR